MSFLTKAAADLLYSALGHLHDDRYLQSVPQQDHGGLSGLGDDDHMQYYNQTRGDARYLQSANYVQPGVVLIEEQLAGSGGVSSFDFQNIPSSYAALEIELYC